ncbi:MAG: RagB/SusD family nutrient uptake outer membrane protein [Muribaculaceae bacterium]|nr:RagB/SusD family nutrient uptake outer membrane protein [Muribaculaceae bacterium]
MKQIYKLLAAGSVVFGATLASCSDFLTEEPNGKLVPEAFFQTANDLDMAVNALYFNVAQAWSNSNPCIPAVQGDDMTSTTGSNKSAYLSADSYSEPSDYKGINALWLWQYNVIQAANPIIDNAARAQTTQENINVALGNAYFWRACAYFQLVRTFGPLPLNLHNESDNNSTPLSSVEDVYRLIESDLVNAENCNLPESYAGRNLGYVGNTNVWISKQAVKSLMAAVYMNMAGYPLNLGTEYYKKAAEKAKEVIDGVKSGIYPHHLEADWKDVYSYGNNFSAEQIVTISYYAVPGQMGSFTSNVSQFPLCHRFSELNSGWGDFIPERYFWSRFPDGPRKNAVYDPLINTYLKDNDGNYLCVSWWATKDKKAYNGSNAVVGMFHPMFSSFSVNADESGAPIAAPYDYSKPQVTLQSIDLAHRFIRYSEVLCWFAESAARAGVYQSEALAALKEVQDRAYAPGVTPDNSDLAEAAYREHGYEVAGYPLALVTRRSDEFRMNRLEEAWRYRTGAQNAVIVPAGTVTHSYEQTRIVDPVTHRPKYVNAPITYVLEEDIVIKETMDVTAPWDGINSIYQVYPPQETEKNPLIKR